LREVAKLQDDVIAELRKFNKPVSLRILVNSTKYSYHQVASALVALCHKGYVRRIASGVYEVTESAITFTLSPEAQVRYLKGKVMFLENEIRRLYDLLYSANSGTKKF
jgi:hypothetical protein